MTTPRVKSVCASCGARRFTSLGKYCSRCRCERLSRRKTPFHKSGESRSAPGFEVASERRGDLPDCVRYLVCLEVAARSLRATCVGCAECDRYVPRPAARAVGGIGSSAGCWREAL